VESSVCHLSLPNTYSYVQEEYLGSTRKLKENYLLFMGITNQILALHPRSLGWRTFLRQRKKGPPAHVQQVQITIKHGAYEPAGEQSAKV
jgi:hypothetical protein